jgi:cytoskeletal protein CcmA (bactofilin family)
MMPAGRVDIMFNRGGRAQAGAQGSKFSFIGPEVTVTGDIVTDGALHIDGKVTGDVRCGSLTQGESGVVHGNIAAGEVRLAGLVDGAVEAGALSLEVSARVTGDVLYEAIGIAPGALIEGRLKRRKGRGDSAPAVRAHGREAPPLFAAHPPTAEAAE